MTPNVNPNTPEHNRYNIAHTKTRNVIERAFGVLKMRFRCLDTTAGKLMFSPERSCKIILACFILHNMAHKVIRMPPSVSLNFFFLVQFFWNQH